MTSHEVGMTTSRSGFVYLKVNGDVEAVAEVGEDDEVSFGQSTEDPTDEP